MNNNKKFLKIILALILSNSMIFSSITFGANNIEILGCTSGKNPWECEIGKACTCRISGTCTEGNLIVYKDNIYNTFCMPIISSGISVISLDACGVKRGEIKVRASCLEGNSIEKIISVVEFLTPFEPKPTTTILIPTTTSRTCSEIGEKCIDLECCEGLVCCDDNTCKEYCEKEDSKNFNIWILIIPLLGIFIIFIFFLLIKKKGEIE